MNAHPLHSSVTDISAGIDYPRHDAAYFAELMARVAKDKDRPAFAALYDHFAPRVKSFLIKGGATPDVADELAQEAMLTLWQRAETFDPARASVSTWIFTIARNKRIDSLRRVRPALDLAIHDEDTIPIADETPSASDMLSAHQETDLVGAALEKLPEEQSSLLYKSFFEDKSHADIAKESGLPLGTVKSRIRLALEKLSANSKVRELWI